MTPTIRHNNIPFTDDFIKISSLIAFCNIHLIIFHSGTVVGEIRIFPHRLQLLNWLVDQDKSSCSTFQDNLLLLDACNPVGLFEPSADLDNVALAVILDYGFGIIVYNRGGQPDPILFVGFLISRTGLSEALYDT